MVKFMKKLPAGTLLVPMFISALINTFFPGIFKIGSSTEALFAGNGVPFIVGLLSFISATLLDFGSIVKILKKQGVLVGVKIVFCFIAGVILLKTMGNHTYFGLSALVILIALCSTNPAMYLALANDYGDESDAGAFGLLGLVSIPAFPMLVYSVARGGGVDILSIFSAFFPIIVGIILGNLDKEFRNMTAPALGILTPFLGWGLGANINLITAFKAGLPGLLLVVIFYLTLVPVLYLVERKILNFLGSSTFSMSSVAGVSLAAPAAILATDPSIGHLVGPAVAQLTFAVVITSIISPIVVKRIEDKKKRDIASGKLIR